MNCPNCGRAAEGGMRFCPYCGCELSGKTKRRSVLKYLIVGIVAAAFVAALAFVSVKLLSEYASGAFTAPREAAALSIKRESYAECIYPNEPVKLIAEVYPEGAEPGAVKWSSSDESVAVVDPAGSVRFLRTGEAVIYAVLENGVSAQTTLLCGLRPYRLTFAKQSDMIELGASMVLKPIIAPAEAQYSGIEWSSSDESTVIVESDGRITGVCEGRATITATVAGDVVGKTEIFVYKYPFDILMNRIYEHGVYDKEYDEYFILLDYAESRPDDSVAIKKRTYISLFPNSDQLVLYCDVYSDDGAVYYEVLVYFGREDRRTAKVQFYCDCERGASSKIENIPMAAVGGRLEINAVGAIDLEQFIPGAHIEFKSYEGDEDLRARAEAITDELVSFSIMKLREDWEELHIGSSIGETLGLKKF